MNTLIKHTKKFSIQQVHDCSALKTHDETKTPKHRVNVHNLAQLQSAGAAIMSPNEA
jgi:hypothetical protein